MIRRRDYRFAYPEFLPDPERVYRNGLREKLERQDMLARRENCVLPEFYVGSIVAVTTTKSQVEGPCNYYISHISGPENLKKSRPKKKS